MSVNHEQYSVDMNETDFETTEWQGGKYLGSIYEKRNGTIIIVSVNGKKKTIKVHQFSSKEEALQHAKEYKIKLNDEMGLTRNRYKIVFNSTNEPTYLIVQLAQKFVMLCDFQDLDIIKKNTLYISKCGFRKMCVFGTEVTSFAKYITGFKNINHMNGNFLDNRRENLENIESVELQRYVYKTFLQKIEGGLVEANVIYVDPTKTYENSKEIISKIFNTRKQAREYIQSLYETPSTIVNENILMEYNDIMKEYANGFKWNNKFKETSNKKECPYFNDVENKKEILKNIDKCPILKNKKLLQHCPVFQILNTAS